MSKVPEIVTRKIGPLPAYGWGLIFVGALGGFIILRRRGGGTGTEFDTKFGGPGTAPTPPPFGGIGGGGSGGGSPSPIAEPTPDVEAPSQFDLFLRAQLENFAGMFGALTDRVNEIASRPAQIITQIPAPGSGSSNQNPAPVAQAPAPAPLSPYPTPSQNQIAPTPPVQPPVAAPVPQGAPTQTAPAPVWNIPQAGLTAGQFNSFNSPGGTVGGLQGWSAWTIVQDASAPAGWKWQEYNPGDYSKPGDIVGLLPRGMSLPGGLTSRYDRGEPLPAGWS